MNEQISETLQKAHDLRTTPGAVVGYTKDGVRNIVASGNLTYAVNSPRVGQDTLYDVASITKSIPLSSLVHIAIQEGRLQLDTKAQELVPELKGKYHQLIAINHLLTYTAIWDIPNGLSAYAAQGAKAVQQAVTELSLVAKPGKKYYYTNTPAVVLSMMIENIYNKPLDIVAQEKLFTPLSMKYTTFDATPYADETVTPTEISENGDVHKIVHDETARALREQNIVSGNAGLFTTAGDLLNYCSMLLNDGKTMDGKQIFTSKTLKSFETNYIASINESASLGWELNQPNFMGKNANPAMFGKTGFTGCVVMIDRARQTAMVLLTNAQYPKRHPDRGSVNELRRAVADIVFS
ncbi:beta-lactamase family protein [Candidatus Saccharibacteria bacterium]|nr:beta-lactamase family protein [Candidatus Saccharibacteria bacterium]MCB9834920.1 beta-lactamase family protein [Candidatus Nomurabacteria bacterium]